MKFVKYKNILSKVISEDSHSMQIHSQEPETFTHLSLFVSKKDVSKVDNVNIKSFEELINFLDSKNFFSNMVRDLMVFDKHNQLIRVITSKSLEKASDLNFWIEDLHEADYKSVISEIINKHKN